MVFGIYGRPIVSRSVHAFNRRELDVTDDGVNAEVIAVSPAGDEVSVEGLTLGEHVVADGSLDPSPGEGRPAMAAVHRRVSVGPTRSTGGGGEGGRAAPAEDSSGTGLHAAGVVVAGSQAAAGRDAHVGAGRSIGLAVSVVSPAERRTVEGQSTGVEGSAADLVELTNRRIGLAIGIVAGAGEG